MMLSRRFVSCGLGLAILASAAFGQRRDEQEEAALAEQQQQQQQQALQRQQEAAAPGRVAESAVGRAGQRQTREDAAPIFRPTERVSNRIQNRIQSRIDNRIDRDYDPQAAAASPFARAEEEARSTR